MSANATSLPADADSPSCSGSRTTVLILIGFSVTNVLLVLPLSALVLCLGCWRRRVAVASHADVFTYHSLVMELLTVGGCIFYCVGAHARLAGMVAYSLEIFSSTWCIKIHFHTLTCVERYLAVVHPVTYRRLKNRGGVRIRNGSIACVWLTCLLWATLLDATDDATNMILYLSLVLSSTAVICFCCVTVLWALRRPGPGEARGSDQMKRRAFNTIALVMAVLLLCLGGMLLGNAQVAAQLLSNGTCVVMATATWFSLPSSFVLPVLFLHRAGAGTLWWQVEGLDLNPRPGPRQSCLVPA